MLASISRAILEQSTPNAVWHQRGVTMELMEACWGNAGALTLHTSTGKGGAFFVRACMQGEQSAAASPFIVKSLSRAEAELFEQLMPAYVRHVTEENPASLLVRVYGIYRVGRRLHFMVMENAVRCAGGSPPRAVYDLKGSAVHREKPGMDLQWTRESLWPLIPRATMDAIERDARFLESHNLMDYSLLAVVFAGTSSTNNKDVEERHYQLTIIDFLQAFNWKKSLANKFKSLVYHGYALSSVPPAMYARRFVAFIEGTFEIHD